MAAIMSSWLRASTPRLGYTGLVAAWVFYSLVLLSMSLIMPRQELLSYPLPTAAAFQAAFQSAAIGNIVLFAGLLGLVSTWNALFFSATRILLVLAADSFVPPAFTAQSGGSKYVGTRTSVGAALSRLGRVRCN
jgi:amino acid transporter